MEEEIGQPFTFRGRWRGRRLWILAFASLLAAAAVFALVWIKPSSDDGAGQAAPVPQETAQPQEPAEPAGAGDGTADAQAQQPAAQGGGQQPTVTPGTGGTAPGLVVQFPDPAGTPGEPPPGGYKDVYGSWVLEMSGSAYGLTNCHLVLNRDGTITSPPDYDPVFQIAASTFTWREGDPAFSATLQLTLKMGGGQMLIPLRVDLAGNTASDYTGISGDFTAEPQGEAYAPYIQQGTFTMHR